MLPSTSLNLVGSHNRDRRHRRRHRRLTPAGTADILVGRFAPQRLRASAPPTAVNHLRDNPGVLAMLGPDHAGDVEDDERNHVPHQVLVEPVDHAGHGLPQGESLLEGQDQPRTTITASAT